jgi:parvulin-like peptidyl-prolyl isomerase
MKKSFVLIVFACVLLIQKHAAQETDSVSAHLVSPSEMDPETLLESYRQRVIKGEKMSEIARLYSQDPGSAKKGGLYMGVKRGMMVEEFEKVAFALQPGEISQVFETTYGFHFIQLIAIKGESVDLMHVLIKKN